MVINAPEIISCSNLPHTGELLYDLAQNIHTLK
jgi:hypothetical protein